MSYEGLPFEGLPPKFYVFPLHTPVEGGCSCRRAECSNVGKHPRTMNGLSDATNDLEQVRKWWDMWPGANVGVACGASGIVVIDVDARHGGDETLRDLIDGNDWPETPTSLTGNGEHYYFRAPADTPIRNSAGVLGPGVDVRGDGGYVVAPPSWHANGRQYEWQAGLEPGAVKGAELPDWIVARLTAPSERRNEVTPIGQVIPQGQRDETLTSIAGSMRRRGMGEQSILAALREENRARCEPPLPDTDLQRIARSVARYKPSAGVPIKSGITTYQRLRKIGYTPPRYKLEINGTDVVVTGAQLLNHNTLRLTAMEQIDALLPAMKRDEWDGTLQSLLAELEILPAAEDASEAGLIWHTVRAYIRQTSTDDETKYESSKPLERDGDIYVNGSMLRVALRQRGLIVEQPRLWDVFMNHGGRKANVRIDGKQRWAWALPQAALEEAPNDL